jgi:hypothetical protein
MKRLLFFFAAGPGAAAGPSSVPWMRSAIVGALVLGVGCGGTTSGASQSGPGSSVTGTVRGNAIPTTSVVAVNQASNGGSTVVVGFVNFTDACSVIQSNHRPGSTTSLLLAVETAGEPTTGTYTINPISNTVTVVLDDGGGAPITTGISLPYATATFGQTNAGCMSTTDDTESSGSITLTTVSSSEVAGSFDVTFPNGDHLTGSFDAPVCAVPTRATTTTCGG